MDGNPEIMPILDSTIRKAIKNGWYFEFEPVTGKEQPSIEKAESFEIDKLVLTVTFTNGAGRIFPCVDMITFDHSFASAFWGIQTCKDFHTLKIRAGRRSPFSGVILAPPTFMWQHYLQQMVLKEAPIQYLAKFL